ncbi:MAG: General secretion pathway protein G [Microgenomates group bacterium Gr01-1014_5]|nr:MAG: General secretion pathway protein G [Microgenomates group bacterium Gr01-1014_5]
MFKYLNTKNSIKISNFKFQIGFTLIELMVAITIVGILVALSTSAFLGAKRSARDAERKADLEDIRSALEIYRSDCGLYPPDTGAGALVPGAALTATCAGAVNTYMSLVPQDPLKDQSGYVYKYTRLTSSTYRLCAYLENGSGVVIACGKCDESNAVDCNYSAVNP